jgi:hypothetical protein
MLIIVHEMGSFWWLYRIAVVVTLLVSHVNIFIINGLVTLSVKRHGNCSFLHSGQKVLWLCVSLVMLNSFAKE